MSREVQRKDRMMKATIKVKQVRSRIEQRKPGIPLWIHLGYAE